MWYVQWETDRYGSRFCSGCHRCRVVGLSKSGLTLGVVLLDIKGPPKTKWVDPSNVVEIPVQVTVQKRVGPRLSPALREISEKLRGNR